MADYDLESRKINAQREVGLADIAGRRAIAETQAAATRDAASLSAAAHRDAARTAIAPEMNRQEGLGDIGSSYGGGRLDLAASRREAAKNPDIGPVVGLESGPIQVIRGTRSTWAGGRPDEEWPSLQRAAQAINRATNQGEYAPPGASAAALQHQYNLAEIAQRGKSLEVAGQQARLAQTDAHNYLGAMLKNLYGVREKDAKGNPVVDSQGNPLISLPDFVEKARLQALPQIKTMDDVKGFLEKMGPEVEQGKHLDLFNNPATREPARAQILRNYREETQAAGRGPDLNTENYIKTEPVSPANLNWFRQAYQRPPVARKTETPTSSKDLATKPIAPPLWTPNRSNPWGEILRRYGQKDWEPEPLPFRADGGPVEEDRPYVVGERGPELFVPKTAGTVVPNKDLNLSDLSQKREASFSTETPGGGLERAAAARIPFTKLGEQVPEEVFSGKDRGASPVEGAPHLLRTPEGDNFARTYAPRRGGVLALDVPVKAPQSISHQDLLAPESMAKANEYLRSVGARELDEDFLKTNPDAARGMILDSLNKAGIRAGGPTYQVTPDLQRAARTGVDNYARGLSEVRREPDLSTLARRVSAPAVTPSLAELAPGKAPADRLTPEQERNFQTWYGDHAARWGLDANPDVSDYDFRGAFLAGAGPNESGYWPSSFSKKMSLSDLAPGRRAKTGSYAYQGL